MLFAGIPIIIRGFPFSKRSAPNPQAWILGKLLQQKLEISRLERNVRIKASHHIVLYAFNFLVARIESMDFPSEMTFLAFRHSHQFNPFVLGSITHDYFVSVVG